MLFFYYLNEIKYRIFYCCLSYIFNFFISFFYVKELLFISVKPLLDINNIHEFSYFIFTNMVDVLMVYIKIILIVSFIFTIPVFLIQFWFFLVNGLYRYEKNFLFFILFLSLFLFFCIIILLYAYLIPFIWLFFLNFELTSINSLFGMYYEARITDYIDFMLYIYILFCCFIQLPIVMILCIYYGLLKIEFFINYRKYFIIGTFIVGGLFSPPDILSQIFISMFVLVIFEVIIIFVLLINNYIKKMINKY